MQRFIIKIAKMIIKEPIEKFIKLIFSLKISIENKTPNGIFKLFMIANIELGTSFAPLFHKKNPIPVGTIPKYRIDNICRLVKELV